MGGCIYSQQSSTWVSLVMYQHEACSLPYLKKKKKNQSLEHEKHFIYSVSTTLSQWFKHLHTPQLSEREGLTICASRLWLMMQNCFWGTSNRKFSLWVEDHSSPNLSPFVMSLHSYLIWSGALWEIIKCVLWWKSHWLESLNLSFWCPLYCSHGGKSWIS